MSNNKSLNLLRMTGSHKFYKPISSTFDGDRMAELSNLIVSITGQLEYVLQVSTKFLDFVDEYKTNLQPAIELFRSSGVDVKSVAALMEYFSAFKSLVEAEKLIQRIFDAERWCNVV